MRNPLSLLSTLALIALAGCASDEYSQVPEPTGPWVPANPPGLMAAGSGIGRPLPLTPGVVR